MEQPIPNRRKDDHEIDLIEIIHILWKARKFIAAVTAISLAIGILYIIFATKMYSGTITLYPAAIRCKKPHGSNGSTNGNGRSFSRRREL
jgi:LPS O-antigen subunit length determinant protein (WzzB/FepE family)